MKNVIISGGFDPIHIGHVRMLKEAQALGDRLIVILNNDNWILKKKGYTFMLQAKRKEIIEAMLRPNDFVLLSFHDANFSDRSVCNEISSLVNEYGGSWIFANGGDRLANNIPEYKLCNSLGIEMVFNIGGGKIESSSQLVKKPNESSERPWGKWEMLEQGEGYWVKKITVNPGGQLSLQYHELRAERWTIVQGWGEVTLNRETQVVRPGASVIIAEKDVHRIKNVREIPLIFIEVALGDPKEDDIIRIQDDYGRK